MYDYYVDTASDKTNSRFYISPAGQLAGKSNQMILTLLTSVCK